MELLRSRPAATPRECLSLGARRVPPAGAAGRRHPPRGQHLVPARALSRRLLAHRGRPDRAPHPCTRPRTREAPEREMNQAYATERPSSAVSKATRVARRGPRSPPRQVPATRRVRIGLPLDPPRSLSNSPQPAVLCFIPSGQPPPTDLAASSPVAKAAWKLSPPIGPCTSIISPNAHRSATPLTRIVRGSSASSASPPAVTSA